LWRWLRRGIALRADAVTYGMMTPLLTRALSTEPRHSDAEPLQQQLHPSSQLSTE